MEENLKTLPETERGKTVSRVILYTVITFILSYAYGFGLLPFLNRRAQDSEMMLILFQTAYSAIMFFPALGALLTRLITREGFRTHYLRPNLRGNIGTYLLAWFAPFFCTIIGAVVWFLIQPGSFDPEMGYLTALLGGQELPVSPLALILIQVAEALLLAPVLNAVPCFGEEWGWRGYLVPKLNTLLKPVPMLLLSGVIWGLWHAPVIALGHNYGLDYPGAPWGGILMMCVFTTFTGVLLSYVTLKTRSCLPAVIAHGMLNGIAAIGGVFTQDGGNPFLGPLPVGIVGMTGFIALAVLLVLVWKRAMPPEAESGENGEGQTD